MKKLFIHVIKSLSIPILLITSTSVFSDTILIDKPKGSVIKLTQKGNAACGTVNWGSIRQSGNLKIAGKKFNMKEPKLPLSKSQWQKLLSKIAGNKKDITIAHAWNKGPAGIAAALRVAYDIRSHGGTAWVLNGPIGNNKTTQNCAGNYAFTGKPQEIYMKEVQFWTELRKGQFLDARGRGAKAPPSYTWINGSPVKAKAIDIASFTNGGKVDIDSYSCDVFKDVSVAGCDSVHKTFLAVEAAKYAKCETQPKIMPYWGLAGASRHTSVAKKVWGNNFVPNQKRSGEILR